VNLRFLFYIAPVGVETERNKSRQHWVRLSTVKEESKELQQLDELILEDRQIKQHGLPRPASGGRNHLPQEDAPFRQATRSRDRCGGKCWMRQVGIQYLAPVLKNRSRLDNRQYLLKTKVVVVVIGEGVPPLTAVLADAMDS
jgi:hypothetical protein